MTSTIADLENKSLYLIDTSGFIFRAYHALPPLVTANGIPTGAVYGFTNMLFKLLEQEKPDYIAAVFDSGRAAGFRRELYQDYKANRPTPPEELSAQFPLVKQIIEAFNISALELETFEADDLIAHLARAGEHANMKVTIVSSDKDLMQLVGSSIRMLDTMKDKIFDSDAVIEKFGVAPKQLGDWLALVGDASDNVPGVPGVGAKTATKLLTQYEGLEDILNQAEHIKGKKLSANLQEFAEQARLSRKLVALQEDLPLGVDVKDLEFKRADTETLFRLFNEFEFGRLRGKVAPESIFDTTAFEVIENKENLFSVLPRIEETKGLCAIDFVLENEHPIDLTIVGLSLCWSVETAIYIPLGTRDLLAPKGIEYDDLNDFFDQLKKMNNKGFVFSSSKKARLVFEKYGWGFPASICDISLTSYVLDPQRDSHQLDTLALLHLGHQALNEKEVLGKTTIAAASVEALAKLSTERSKMALKLAPIVRGLIEKDPDLKTILDDIEIPLAKILADLERRGTYVDVDFLRELSQNLKSDLQEIEARIHRQAGWAVNINSPKQLQKLLFDQLGLTKGKKTKTGYSTDSDVLSQLAMEHPIAGEIEEYRGLSKLVNGYLDALPALVNRRTGRIHASYNQVVTATGRLSSSDPNMQNIPIRTEIGKKIRSAFIAPNKKEIISADYSQIELRVLAHLSSDPLLVRAFKKGEDIHRRTAAEVFSLEPDEVDSEQRRVAKAVNFGVVYGQSDWGLAKQLGIAKVEAKRYIDGYFDRYQGVKAFMDRVIADAHEHSMVKTMLGRRRFIADINSKRYQVRSYAERMARNTPIQGTAADILKLAMIAVERALVEEALEAKMILTVHDELVFEVDRDQVDATMQLVNHAMSTVVRLDVPLVVDISRGADWAQAH